MARSATPTTPTPATSGTSTGRGRTRLARDAYVTLHVLDSALTRQVEQCCRARGLTQAQFNVLWVVCLWEDPAGPPIGAIADGLLTQAADASRLVDRLVAGGHVTREPSPEDRRISHVRPTPAGRKVLADLVEEVDGLHRRQLETLDAAELAELSRLLGKLLEAASAPS